MTNPPPALPTTREQLPHYVDQTDGHSGQCFLHGVYLGFTRNEWSVQAFAADTDGGSLSAARWAAEKPTDRVVIGPITIPDDIPVRAARCVPQRYELTDLTDAPTGDGE